MNHILANIQGTTFQSAIVFCASMRIKTTAQQEFPSTSLAVSVVLWLDGLTLSLSDHVSFL